jgi:hypothetical protein
MTNTAKSILNECGLHNMVETLGNGYDEVRTSDVSFEKTVTFLKNDSTRVHIFIIATIEEEAVKFELFFFGANEPIKSKSIPLDQFNLEACLSMIEDLKLQAKRFILSPIVHELS